MIHNSWVILPLILIHNSWILLPNPIYTPLLYNLSLWSHKSWNHGSLIIPPLTLTRTLTLLPRSIPESFTVIGPAMCEPIAEILQETHALLHYSVPSGGCAAWINRRLRHQPQKVMPKKWLKNPWIQPIWAVYKVRNQTQSSQCRSNVAGFKIPS